MKKYIQILLAVVFVFLWFYLVDFGEALHLIENVSWNYIILAVLFGLTQSFFGAIRLKTLFSVISSISTAYVFAMSYIATAISTILPFYVGGFSVSYFFKNKIKTVSLRHF